MPFFFLETIL